MLLDHVRDCRYGGGTAVEVLNVITVLNVIKS